MMTWAEIKKDWETQSHDMASAFPLLDLNDFIFAAGERDRLVARLVARGMGQDAAELAVDRFADKATPGPLKDVDVKPHPKGPAGTAK